MHSLGADQSNPDLLADPLGPLRSLIRYVVLLWKNPVNVLSMGNSVADYDFVLLIHCNGKSVLTIRICIYLGSPSFVQGIRDQMDSRI